MSAPTRRGLLALAPAAALVTPATAAPHPDAKLLAACARFRAFNARHIALFTTIPDEDERDAAYDEFHDEMAESVDAMCALPAVTLDGVVARGLALAEYYPEQLNPDWVGGCWDSRQLAALLRDLVAIG